MLDICLTHTHKHTQLRIQEIRWNWKHYITAANINEYNHPAYGYAETRTTQKLDSSLERIDLKQALAGRSLALSPD